MAMSTSMKVTPAFYAAFVAEAFPF